MRLVQRAPDLLLPNWRTVFSRSPGGCLIWMRKSSTLHIAFSKILAGRFERVIHHLINPLNKSAKPAAALTSMCPRPNCSLFSNSAKYSVTIWSLKHTGVKQSPHAITPYYWFQKVVAVILSVFILDIEDKVVFIQYYVHPRKNWRLRVVR